MESAGTVIDDHDNPLAMMAAAEARLRIADAAGVEALLDGVTVRAQTDRRLRARMLTARSMLETLRSRPERAWDCAQQAVELWSAVGDRGEAASARALGARALLSLGSAEQAMTEVMAALDEANALGDPRVLLNTMTGVAHTHYGIQRFDEALVYFERALVVARSVGDRVAEGGLLDAIACTYGSRAAADGGRVDEPATRRLLDDALGLWRDASLIARETGNRRNEAAALANQAEALVLLGRPEEALALLQSWSLDPAVDLDRIIWHHRDTEGVVCIRLGRYADAIALLTDALSHADGGAQKMVAYEHLADACERNGDAVSALAHYRQFHAFYKQVASEAAQRSASIAAVRLATAEANAMADAQRDRAEQLEVSNDRLSRRADDLMQLSLEDPLTGLANRRMMDRLLETDARGFAVAMLDVDHFKRVNDRWSHAVGDDVLRRLAILMRGCCRASDTPIRSGGEEFAILLRQLDEPAAIETAERIRRAIEAYDWSSVASGLAVTVSIGVAIASEGATTTEVLALADRRLYEAKDAGRNRVVGRAGPVRASASRQGR